MKTKVYFGTYTRGKSEGIYQAELDENSGQLHNLQLLVKTNSPTYLGISKDFIYSVHKDGEQGGIATHHKSGQLINTVLLDGVDTSLITDKIHNMSAESFIIRNKM